MQRSSFIPNRTWLNKWSRASAYTSHRACRLQLTACPCLQATTYSMFERVSVTRVELLNLGVKMLPAGAVTGVRTST